MAVLSSSVWTNFNKYMSNKIMEYNEMDSRLFGFLSFSLSLSLSFSIFEIGGKTTLNSLCNKMAQSIWKFLHFICAIESRK